MMRFGGKLAVVTGAASGIGLATAEMLAAEGAFVIGTDRHDHHAATWAPMVAGRGLFLRHDVRDALGWRHVMQTALGRYGRLDVLVNAAGVNGVLAGGTPPQQVDDMDAAIWAFVTGVNAEGVMLGCRFALQAMRGRGGAIVNISSIAAKKGWTLRAAYGVSKASVLQHTKSVARQAGENGWRIRCNAVLPGPIETPMLFPGGKLIPLAGAAGNPVAHVPMGRMGKAAEVAAPILFLASDEASYITGAGLHIDGGLAAT